MTGLRPTSIDFDRKTFDGLDLVQNLFVWFVHGLDDVFDLWVGFVFDLDGKFLFLFLWRSGINVLQNLVDSLNFILGTAFIGIEQFWSGLVSRSKRQVSVIDNFMRQTGVLFIVRCFGFVIVGKQVLFDSAEQNHWYQWICVDDLHLLCKRE